MRQGHPGGAFGVVGSGVGRGRSPGTQPDSHLRGSPTFHASVRQGRLERLEVAHQSGLRPSRAGWAAYTRPQTDGESETPHSLFQSNLLALRRVKGRRVGLESTLQLSEKLRNAVVKHCPEPVPEWVSGHTPDGRPSQTPHIALLPLPFVGGEHADGHLLGFALAIPN